jgi:tetratricopeptide (TPR) repeat protein
VVLLAVLGVSGVGAFAFVQWRAAVASLVAERKAVEDLQVEQHKSAELAERRRKVSAFYQEHILATPKPAGQGLGKDVTLREALDRAAGNIGPAFAGAPEDEAQVCQELGDTYARLGESGKAEKLLRRALVLRRQTLGDDHRDTLISANTLAPLLVSRGRAVEAGSLLERTTASARAALGEDDPVTLSLRHNLAWSWYCSGRSADAETALIDIVARRRRLLTFEHEHTLASTQLLGITLAQRGKVAEGRKMLEEALRGFVKVLGPTHPGTLFCKHNLGFLLLRTGQFEPAVVLVRQARDGRVKVLGRAHPDTLASQALLVALASCRKKGLAAAERLALECIGLAETELVVANETTVNFQQNLAAIYLHQGKCPQALRLAWRLLEAGKDDDTRAILARVRQIRMLSGAADHAADVQSAVLEAWLKCRGGESVEAQRQLRRALAEGRKRLPAGHWLLGLAEGLLGAALAARQKYADAEPLALSGYETLRDAGDAPREHVREARARLVALYTAWNRPEAAARWRKQAPGPKESD